jgi:hypothetical protein
MCLFQATVSQQRKGMVNLKDTILFCVFVQRKELLKQREVVEARKKILQENITNQRKFLGSLLSHLKVLKKASLPVQQQLGLLHTKRMKQHALAELLPPALYIVYTQLLSHKEAFEEALELEIVGSAKDALTLAQQAAMKDAGSLLTNYFYSSELFCRESYFFSLVILCISLSSSPLYDRSDRSRN